MGTNKLKKQTPNSVVNIVERILPTVSSCLVQCCTTRPSLQAIASDTKSKSQPSQSHLRGDRSEDSNQIHHMASISIQYHVLLEVYKYITSGVHVLHCGMGSIQLNYICMYCILHHTYI